MKLSFTLLFAALAPAAKAIDFFPNLRGIAVEVAEEAERYGKNGSACRGYEHKCSTAGDAKEQHRCCEKANTKVLTCAKDSEPDEENPQFDGTCIESSGDVCFDIHKMYIVCEDDYGEKDDEKCANHWAAPLAAKAGCRIICNYNSRLEKHICVQGGGEEEVAEEEQNLRGVVGIALTTGEERGYGPAYGHGPGATQCRHLDHHCSTSDSTIARHKCCETDPRTGKELYCDLDDTVSGPFYDGKCKVAQAEAPGGVVGIALTTGEESGYRGQIGAPECRKVNEYCDTSHTALPTRKCCGLNERGTKQELFCNSNVTVSSTTAGYDGVCSEVAASAPREVVGIALTTGEERVFSPLIPICREEGKSCSNDGRVLKRNPQRRCCNEGELDTVGDLICNPDESVRSGRNGIKGYNGKCVVAQAEAPSEAPSEI